MPFFSYTPALLILVFASVLIAMVAPFDVAFTALTAGSMILRGVVMGMIALTGAYLARRAGLRLEGHDARSPLGVGVLAAVGMAIYVVALDGLLLRPLLSPGYVHFIQSPLESRLAYFMLRAFNENVIYRLFVFSGLVCLISMFRRSRDVPTSLIVLAAVATQLLNIGMNVVALSDQPMTWLLMVYDCLRYIAPGVLWAILFRRFGFATAEVASVGCHLLIQPAYSLLF